jgi:RNA polymerase sigma-70 factor (ECF subfamily)
MPEPAPLTDDSLFDAVRRGDAAAFWKLANRYRPYLKRVAQKVLQARLPGDGSDVVHDGLIAAFEHLAQFQGSQASVFLGWLATIVRNKSLQALNRAGSVVPLPQGEDGGEILATSSTGPDERAVERERAARLMMALQRLREDHRRVIELRNLQDLSFREVAERMERSEDAVRQLWVRAIDKLKEEWGDNS